MPDQPDPHEVALAEELQAQADRIWQARPLHPSRASLERRVQRRARLRSFVAAGGWIGLGAGLTWLMVLGFSGAPFRTVPSQASQVGSSAPTPSVRDGQIQASAVPASANLSQDPRFSTDLSRPSYVLVAEEPGKPAVPVRPGQETNGRFILYPQGTATPAPAVEGRPVLWEPLAPTYQVEQLEQKTHALEERINQLNKQLQQLQQHER